MSIYTGDCNCFDNPAPAGRPPLEDDPLARERIAEGDYRYYHPRAAAPENEKCSACGYTIPHTKHRVVVAAPTGEPSEEEWAVDDKAEQFARLAEEWETLWAHQRTDTRKWRRKYFAAQAEIARLQEGIGDR